MQALSTLILVSIGPATALADEGILRTAETIAATQYAFTAADNELLDQIERACFDYFWKEVGTPAALAKDRQKAPVASSAAIGFQLSSLPIGVERGWKTRAECAARAVTVLRSLLDRDDNKKFGVYLHYPDMNTAGLSHEGFEILAGTVDHALLLAGAITAGEYFGGDVRQLADRMVADTDWRAFAGRNGLLSMGWRPDDPQSLAGRGKFLDAQWFRASDEERLTYFLAVSAPRAEHAVAPELYYKLQRMVKRHRDLPPYAVSYGGPLFNYFFSHCWINYRGLEADDPAQFGGTGPRIDWFENSRRAALTQRQRCIEMAERYKTLSADRWGLSACAARDGYIVPEIRPNECDCENWHAGTVAPYAAGAAIMFTPTESIAALRAFRELRKPDGQLLVWRDPQDGGYGLVDSFNLDQQFACDDYVGIDHGPLLLGIENARTGLIWRIFMESETARRGVERLKLVPRATPASQPMAQPAAPPH
jgi:hypothetical protein